MRHFEKEAPESVTELVSLEGMRAISGLLTTMCQKLANDVLTYNLDTGTDKALALKKAELDGAKKLIAQFDLFVRNKSPKN